MSTAVDVDACASTRLRYQLFLNPGVRVEVRNAPDAEVTFLAMDSIGEDGTIQRDTSRPVSELLSGYSYFENDDVLLAKVTPCFENGKGAVVTGLPGNAGFGTTEVTVMRSRATLSPRFLYYLTSEDRFVQGGIAAMTGAGGLKRVPDSYVLNFEVSLPSVQTQQQIADYLDTQTAKIDALIGKQEQLIETLAERRQAVISHAVTKGLDPKAPMKASGMPWMGEVPSHWRKIKLRWSFEFLNGDRGVNYPSRDEMTHAGIPFINAGHLRDGRLDFGSMDYISHEKYHQMGGAKLRSGDILYCLRGSLGKNALVDEMGAGALASSLVAIRNRMPERIETRYIFLLLNSAAEVQQRDVISSGSAQPNLSADSVAAFAFYLPSISEQRAVFESVRLETRRIDALSAKAREMIEVLKERRRALISAAVTGKIDVRTASGVSR